MGNKNINRSKESRSREDSEEKIRHLQEQNEHSRSVLAQNSSMNRMQRNTSLQTDGNRSFNKSKNVDRNINLNMNQSLMVSPSHSMRMNSSSFVAGQQARTNSMSPDHLGVNGRSSRSMIPQSSSIDAGGAPAPGGELLTRPSASTSMSAVSTPGDYFRFSSMRNFVNPFTLRHNDESFRKELVYEIPDNCPILAAKQEKVDMVDCLEWKQGLALWRCELESHGVCLGKVYNPFEKAPPPGSAESISIGQGRDEYTIANFGSLRSGFNTLKNGIRMSKKNNRQNMNIRQQLTNGNMRQMSSEESSNLMGQADKANEEIFNNELMILSCLQGRYQPFMINSPSGFEALAQRQRGERVKFQHENIVSFVGYMEKRLVFPSMNVPIFPPGLQPFPGDDDNDEDNKPIYVERRLFTEFYVDSLQRHIQHRTSDGEKDMRSYEAVLYAFQISKGLSFLHRNEVCHRELTSENIVMGFGLLDNEYKKWLKILAAEDIQRRQVFNNVDNMHQSGEEGEDRDNNGYHMRREKARREVMQYHWYKYLETVPLIAKVANFGYARILGNSKGDRRARTKVGSPQYMSPEMHLGQDYDHAVDIWGFGCILYEMICREPPFHKKMKSPAFIEQKVTSGQFPANDQLGSDSFESLEVIMRNCLKTNPRDRSTAQELVDDLKKL